MSMPAVISTAHITLDKAVIPLGTVLKEDGFVFIRVLSSSKDGKALVSFAGNRFEVYTSRPLQRGESFPAKIHIADAKIMLQPQIPPADISLASVPLVVTTDAVYQRLCQYMNESGTTFSSRQLKKIRQLSRFSKTNPETAAEIAAYLEEKSIEPTEELINSIASLFAESTRKKPEKVSSLQNEEPSFLDDIYRFPQEVLAEKSGLLTVANHLGTSVSRWIVLPFTKELGGITYTGNIRMLINMIKKQTDKIYITATNEQKSLIFKIYPPKNIRDVMHIYFASVPVIPPEERDSLLTQLTDSFLFFSGKISAEYVQEISGELFTSASIQIKGVDVTI